ncbi:MAG: site-specific integrase [Alphaproteobacteria bacterium]|nr:site-specific integrase [Alphaproteobacteria bacterium]
MSVYRRGHVYHYEFVVAGVRFRGSTGQTQREAAKAVEAQRRVEAKAQVTEHGRASATGRRDMTLGEAAERYFQERAAGTPSEATTDYQLENLVRLIGGGRLLAHIDDAVVADFVMRRRGERSKRADKTHPRSCRCDRCALSPATVNREIEVLRRVMRRAGRAWKTRIDDMPNWDVHMLTESDQRVRELSADEEQSLFAHLRPDLHPLVLFCLLTGVRKNTAITLTWRQVDFDAMVIRYRAKSRKPGGEHKVIPMTGEIAALLQSQRGHNPVRVFTYICKRGRQQRRQGERYPFSSSGWTKEWRAALRAAGIEDFRFHDIRHTTATRILRHARNLKVVQALLGHSDIATTARYAHALTDDVRAAMEMVPTKAPTVVSKKTENN